MVIILDNYLEEPANFKMLENVASTKAGTDQVVKDSKVCIVLNILYLVYPWVDIGLDQQEATPIVDILDSEEDKNVEIQAQVYILDVLIAPKEDPNQI